MRRYRRRIAIAWAVAAVALGLGSVAAERRTLAAAAPQAPLFEVDPMWPKPLPNHWVLGWATGVTVDAQDHIWIVHQANKLAPGELFGSTTVPGSCCFAALPVL